MATISEYREFAKQSLRWAAEADTEEFKKAFLDMARDWTLAAIRLEGGLTAAQDDCGMVADQELMTERRFDSPSGPDAEAS
jgi:hypothetical protein